MLAKEADNLSDARAAAENFMEANKDYLQSILYPVLDSLVNQVLENRPTDPVPFLIKCLFSEVMKRTTESDATKVLVLEDSQWELQKHIATLKAKLISSIRRCEVSFADRDVKENEEHKSNDKDLVSSSDESTTSDDDDDDEDLLMEMTYEPPDPGPIGRRLPRKSVSAEAYGEFNVRKPFVPPVYPKSDDQRSRIKAHLENIFFFGALDDENMDIVISAVEKVEVPENYRIIQQGDDGDALYIVEEGNVNCLKVFDSNPGEEKCVKICGVGDLFGELALLYNCPRAASVESSKPAIFWKLNRETFSHIAKDSAVQKRETYDGFLANVPLLKDLDTYDRMKIADVLKSEKFDDGAKIVTQGDVGNCFYIVETGKAVAIKTFENDSRPAEVMNYGPSDYFGELALLRDVPRAADIVARGAVKAVSISRKAFKRLLGPLEEVMEDYASKYASERPISQQFSVRLQSKRYQSSQKFP